MNQYTILLLIQVGSIVLLLIEGLYIVSRWKVRMHSLLCLNVFATLINNLGYLMEMTSRTSEAALVGTRICYLGKVFVSLTFFVMLVEFCEIHIPNWVYKVLYIVHAGVFILVLSSDYQKLFYTGWEFKETGLFPHNEFGHGIVYWLYLILVTAYIIIAMVSVLRKVGSIRRKNKRIAMILIAASVIVDAIGMIIFMTGKTNGYDVTALAYVISSILILIAIFKFEFMESMTSMERAETIRKSQRAVITQMATIIESRDNTTGLHVKRTSDVVAIFVDYLQSINAYPDYDSDFFDCISRSAPLHDLGKVAIDDAILRKPGKFTPEEYEEMKRHSSEGARVVSEILCESEDEEFKQIAVNIAHYHHEKWDGNGYPSHLKGEDIPFEARIMALADVFDALVSKRCYKENYSYDKSFEIIKESIGTHFDPTLGKLFLDLRPELERYYGS